ncbi:MMPL family transporter [Nocardioides dongkuii]|uniref:MMPL family transporter n=1 Tax=Nocardioides dongkuii TaxID=2760089 RepID=UPI0015FACB7B|nr:MMPL family transporter [Nocardioides dongkuii]
MTSLTASLARRPRRSLLALLLFVVLAGVLGGPVAGALENSGSFTPPDADSVTALDRIEAATGRAAGPGVVLLLTPDEGAPSPDEAAAELAAVPGMSEVVSSDDAPPGSGLVATDGDSSLVVGTLDADADEEAVAQDVLDGIGSRDGVDAGGQEIAGLQIGETVGKDLGRAEALALPLLLLLSFLFFGGRAMVLPLAAGGTAVLGTFLVLAGVNEVYGLSVFALNLVIGLGLGLTIDYTLFLVTRYREEVARQGATPAAIATTMRTAGRTVVFSAATVAVALATLTVFPLGFLVSMGIAGAVVAVVAATASIVVSAAMFGLWGEKLVRRSRRSAARTGAPDDAGRWYRLSHAVMRRPGAVAVVTAVVMLGLALPALQATWTPIDATAIPTSQSARTVSDAIAADFSGRADSALTVAVATDGPDGGADVAAYAEQVAALDPAAAVADPVPLDADTWQLDVEVPGEPSGPAARELVEQVRDLDAAGVQTWVAGPAAEFVDQQAAIADRLPLAVALLVGLTLLVLWLMTGSVVLPVKSVLMNALTVGTALGALVFVYQAGRFTDVLGYTPNGGVEPTDFLVTSALVFALSTDYGVFLLGRIKEARDSGLPERESVAVGLQRTGSVVTAAAILLAVAIGAFATSSISFIQQIGVATAVGVLVDAFIVRSLLVPALMGLLGRWNWWAPLWLRRVHDRVGFAEGGQDDVLPQADATGAHPGLASTRDQSGSDVGPDDEVVRARP